jgi:hypothetical protein
VKYYSFPLTCYNLDPGISQDEYFEVDESTTKHNGFFVNKGKLEHM